MSKPLSESKKKAIISSIRNDVLNVRIGIRSKEEFLRICYAAREQGVSLGEQLDRFVGHIAST
jgi:hypothetical protein